LECGGVRLELSLLFAQVRPEVYTTYEEEYGHEAGMSSSVDSRHSYEDMGRNHKGSCMFCLKLLEKKSNV